MAEAQFIFVPPREPTRIGVIDVDVMVESEFNLGSEVSEYPVEDGFPISDNVIAKPINLSLAIMISPMPVTWYENFKETAQDRVSNAIDEFYNIWQNREPITIVTHQRVWEDMVMVSCPIRRSKEDGIALKATVDFVQVRKAVVKKIKLSEEFVALLMRGKAGETSVDGGIAEVVNISSGNTTTGGSEPTNEKRQSILAGIFGGK